MARVLIVEDEERISSFVSKGLRCRRVRHRPSLPTATTGLDLALSGDFDLVILDIGLPGLDGFEVLRQMRAQGSSLPVIVLTARDSVTDTVSALEGGADDYMPKPFRFAELLARVRLRLRPSSDQAAETAGTPERRSGHAGPAHPAGDRWAARSVDLSAREFRMAEFFLLNVGQVLSREQLLSHVWGYDFDPGSNVVDVYVGYLRRKFGADDDRHRPRHGLPVHRLSRRVSGP